MASTDRFDIANRYGNINTNDSAYINRTEAEKALKKLYEDKTSLSFTDMLGLMIAQFQNQTIDNQASTTDMMNQLVQMSSMQAMTAMVTQMEELSLANVMSYSASLVGKTVTIGIWDSNGELQEIVGVVEGTGTYDGQQVIYVNGKGYYLSDIMAVGTLPAKTEAPEGSEKPDGGEEDVPTPPVEDSGNPDIDDDGNPIDTPTPPIEDSGAVDIPDNDDGDIPTPPIEDNGAIDIPEDGVG